MKGASFAIVGTGTGVVGGVGVGEGVVGGAGVLVGVEAIF